MQKKRPRRKGVFQYPQPLSPRRIDNTYPARPSGFRITLLPAPSHLKLNSGFQVSFPITAAGPRRFHTVFTLPKNDDLSQAYWKPSGCNPFIISTGSSTIILLCHLKVHIMKTWIKINDFADWIILYPSCQWAFKLDHDDCNHRNSHRYPHSGCCLVSAFTAPYTWLANRFPHPHVHVDGASSVADAVEYTYF